MRLTCEASGPEPHTYTSTRPAPSKRPSAGPLSFSVAKKNPRPTEPRTRINSGNCIQAERSARVKRGKRAAEAAIGGYARVAREARK